MTTPGSAPLRAALGIGGLFELVPDAVIVGDVSSGEVVLWNAAAVDIFGYEADDALGLRLERLVPPDLKAAHLAGVARYASTGSGDLVSTHRLVEVPAVRASGEQIWVELRLAAVGVSDPPRYVVAVVRDVTARRLAEAEAVVQAQRASAGADAMREVLSMVSHDLRAPVAGIRAAHDMLLRRWNGLNEEQREEILRLAERQTTRVITLLDDLLDLSRVESGQLDVRPAITVISTAVTHATEAAGVDQIAIDVPANLTVFVDPDHLERILVNLLTNAVKYGAAPITVTSATLDGVVVLHVDDSGPGVDPDIAPKLFERFTRGSFQEDSHGLGLAIVKGLAEANRGTIAYEPRPRGARFTLTLRGG